MSELLATKVLSQTVVGYRRQGTETVFETVWLMNDGTTRTLYNGNVYDYSKQRITSVEYGAQCPNIKLTQQEGR